MRSPNLFQTGILLIGLLLTAGEAQAGAQQARSTEVRDAIERFDLRWAEAERLAAKAKGQTLERAYTQKDCDFIRSQHRLLVREMRLDKAAAHKAFKALEKSRTSGNRLISELAQISSRAFLEGAIATRSYTEPTLKKEIQLLALQWAIEDLRRQPSLVCLTHDVELLLQQERDSDDSGSSRGLSQRLDALMDKPESCVPGSLAFSLN